MPVLRLAVFHAWLLFACASPQSRTIPLPGGGPPARVASSSFAAPSGSLPLLLQLNGFQCELPQSLLAGLGSLGKSYNQTKSDMASLMERVAQNTAAVVAVLDAPKSARACTLCAQSVAAAQSSAIPASQKDRTDTILGSRLESTAARGGAYCPAWDADAACCQPSPQQGGDVRYILSALAAIQSALPAVNKSRTLLFGLSAGGFMAERLACEAPADTFAALVVYAGGSSTQLRCSSPKPLNYLHLHGQADIQVPFGGSVKGAQPEFIGAEGTLARWAAIDGCPSSGRRETQHSFGNVSVHVVSYDGCKVPLVEGWWVPSWGHIPPQAQSTVDVFLAALRRVLDVTA